MRSTENIYGVLKYGIGYDLVVFEQKLPLLIGIRCHACHRVSFVSERYCDACHVFHEERLFAHGGWAGERP
jgi:hypothetical protein